jgi:DNA-binding MarR family transcriptional regulator
VNRETAERVAPPTARQMLVSVDVHAAFFGLKRAYWGSLRVTRKQLTAMGLTAARFDLLYLLAAVPWELPHAQKEIIAKLGVTPPVVSRMLKALREKGLVSRARDRRNRREWLISLTTTGRLLIRRAIDFFIRSGRAWKRVQRGLCPAMAPGEDRDDEALWRMCGLEEMLDRLREGFRAGGTLYYRWHPDD